MPPKKKNTPHLQTQHHLQPHVSASTAQIHEQAGLTPLVHPTWPEIQFSSGDLFFECTLFLYSVYALCLQYLNLYKSLWWLPKSYWHRTIKFHLINPYFLSCLGLLLGWRVTVCFFRELSDIFSKIENQKLAAVFYVIEISVVKTPLATLISTSFIFSLTRVYRDYPLNCVLYFLCPAVIYILMFYSQIWERIARIRWKLTIDTWKENWDRLQLPPSAQLDVNAVKHMCSSDPARVREEVKTLLADLRLRIKYCVYAGFSTPFLAIVLPLMFAPYQTALGTPVKNLVEEAWQWQIGIIVGLTSFALYSTYLLPLNYLDMCYRSAMHLGTWEPIEGPKVGLTGPANWALPKWQDDILYRDGESVQLLDGRCFKAKADHQIGSVAANPNLSDHSSFYALFSTHTKMINYMLIFETLIIGFQFWLLVLAEEWQHIVTLVLLMFANYLHLGKLVKDRVIIGRVYNPSPEDLAQIEHLKEQQAQDQRPGSTIKSKDD